MVQKEHKFTFKNIHKSNLGKCLIIVMAVHAFLLFFHFKNQIKTATYSTIESSISQIKTVVKLISYQQPKKVVKRKVVKKVKKSKKAITKKVEKEKQEVQTPIKQDVAKQVKIAQGISSAKAKYESMIRELVNENRFYPRISRRLNQTGVVHVQLKILKDGTISSLSIHRPSQHKYLNKGALKTIQKIGKFPEFPKALDISFWEGNIPINYNFK